MPKIVKLEKATDKKHKWVAYFDDGRKTSFGAIRENGEPYEDYTQHNDKLRRASYRKRHAKDLETKDPYKAGYLSYYILWGDSTSIKENVKDYNKRFG